MIYDIYNMSWKKVTQVPQGIWFGCMGNPVKITTNNSICACANTPEKHLLNYKKYLFHSKYYKKYKMTCRSADDLPGYVIFGYHNDSITIKYPDEFIQKSKIELK
jgi:hypothetical protein